MSDAVPPPVTVADLAERLCVVEEVTLVPGTATGFLERLASVYVPEVERRGYALADCLVSPPVEIEGEPTHVVLTWAVDGIWAARAPNPRWDLRLIRDASPGAAAFWSDEAANVSRRFRRVALGMTSPVEARRPAPAAGATAGLPAPLPDPDAVRCIVLAHLASAAELSLLTEVEDHLRDALGSQLLFSHMCPHVDLGPVTGHATWDIVVPAATIDLLPGVLAAVERSCGDAVVALDAVSVQPVGGAIVDAGMTGLVKRTLLFKVRDDADPSGVHDLEQALVGMVDHIPAIRNWCLSRVTPLGMHAGLPQWTHAWEQEYIDADGLLHDYLEAVYHWAHVDAFYDPDDPRGVVEPPLAHVYGWAERSVLTPAMRSTSFPA